MVLWVEMLVSELCIKWVEMLLGPGCGRKVCVWLCTVPKTLVAWTGRWSCPPCQTCGDVLSEAIKLESGERLEGT